MGPSILCLLRIRWEYELKIIAFVWLQIIFLPVFAMGAAGKQKLKQSEKREAVHVNKLGVSSQSLHFVVADSTYQSLLSIPVVKAVKEMITGTTQYIQRESVTDGPKKKKKGSNNSKRVSVSYLYDSSDIKAIADLTSGAEIIIHGEGEPFVIGLAEPHADWDLHPVKLADHLIENGLPNEDITIRLFACHSSATYETMNFAQDLSIVLSDKGFHRVRVIGYTGLLTQNKNGKIGSCCADPFPLSDQLISEFQGRHKYKPLTSCEQSFVDGRAEKLAKQQLSDLSRKPYQWAHGDDGYIKDYMQNMSVHPRFLFKSVLEEIKRRDAVNQH